MKKIGLVGGISWISTLDYYRYINEGINTELGGLNFSECIIYSLNFHEFQQATSGNNWDATFKMIFHACKTLENSGAEAIILCANTAHAVADRIHPLLSVPIIHIAVETALKIKKEGLQKLGLLGTKYTMEMAFYKDKLAEYGLESIIPGEQDRSYIQHTIREQLGRGMIEEETKMKYIDIINRMISEGAEGIILGCTEIPLLIRQEDVSVPVFDTTKIHSMAAVRFALT